MPDDAKVSVGKLREHLADRLRRVSNGGSVVFTWNGAPVARLGPVFPVPTEPRPFGFMQGQIRMALNFGELPGDVVSLEACPPPSLITMVEVKR